jgi:hypothetical protein
MLPYSNLAEKKAIKESIRKHAPEVTAQQELVLQKMFNE